MSGKKLSPTCPVQMSKQGTGVSVNSFPFIRICDYSFYNVDPCVSRCGMGTHGLHERDNMTFYYRPIVDTLICMSTGTSHYSHSGPGLPHLSISSSLSKCVHLLSLSFLICEMGSWGQVHWFIVRIKCNISAQGLALEYVPFYSNVYS